MAGGRAELKEKIDPETLRSLPPDSTVMMTPERKDELAANVKQREFFTAIKNEMHRLVADKHLYFSCRNGRNILYWLNILEPSLP